MADPSTSGFDVAPESDRFVVLNWFRELP